MTISLYNGVLWWRVLCLQHQEGAHLDCSQSPIFQWYRRRSTGHHLRLLMRAKLNPTASTHGYFVLSPVSLASRDQDGGPSNSTIDIYDLTTGNTQSCLLSGERVHKGRKRMRLKIWQQDTKINYSFFSFLYLLSPYSATPCVPREK